jgi:hypothetical protein
MPDVDKIAGARICQLMRIKNLIRNKPYEVLEGISLPV